MASVKIKRPLIWLQTVLEILGQKTTLPESITEEVRPTVDLFGWDRHVETERTTNAGADNTNQVVSAQVPDGFVRFITAASLETTDDANALHLWMAKRTEPGSQQVGLTRPFLAPVGTAGMEIPLERPVLLLENERLVGRSDPAPAVGSALTIIFTSVLLPFGEYVQPL